MIYLWNTGPGGAALVSTMAEELNLPLFAVDHAMPQKWGKEGYDEGAAILAGMVGVCSERPITAAEFKKVEKWWLSK